MAKMTKELVLPEAVGSYVSLFTPRDPPPGSNGKPRYSLVLLYDKKDASKLAQLTAAVTEVAEQKWPGKGAQVVKAMRYPVIADGDDRYPDDPAFKNKLFVRASTQAEPTRRPPGVVDRQMNKLFDDEHAYSGCTFKAHVRLFPFDKAGNRGVSVGLNNVQVVKEGERLDGRRNAEEVFTAVEGDEGPESLM